MQVNVEIKSKQIFKDHDEEEKNKCLGNITYHNNGAVLEFTEKYEEQNIELKFKMTILKEKIITDRNGQTMIFDIKNKDRTTINTPYGVLNMQVTTKKINITKEAEEIKTIQLEYEIELENSMKYDNEVEIRLIN